MLIFTLLLILLQNRPHETFLLDILLLNLPEISWAWLLIWTMACCERSRHRLAGHTRFSPFLHSIHDLYPFDFFLESGKVIDIRFERIRNIC